MKEVESYILVLYSIINLLTRYTAIAFFRLNAQSNPIQQGLKPILAEVKAKYAQLACTVMGGAGRLPAARHPPQHLQKAF
jgi:hypothetical protein